MSATAYAAGGSQGPDQLGGYLSADRSNVVFRVYSQSATRIDVSLYAAPTGAAQIASYMLTQVPGTAIWQAQVPAQTLRNLGFDIDPNNTNKLFTNIYYGYRAWGPNWPYQSGWTPGSTVGYVSDVDTAGNRFNPNKLLLDPYALEISHDYTSTAVNPPSTDATIYASGGTSVLLNTPDRQRDSAAVAPKGIVAMPSGAGFVGLDTGTKPNLPAKDKIIYEAHVRGLTEGDTSVGACRGTYAGAVAKIPSLQQLGINTIEFMPIQETENDANDLDMPSIQRSSSSTNGDNYWGYMTTNFFAPDRHYACDKSIGGPTREFAAMAKAFHDAGIEVLTDVVYNHSGEGGLWGTDPAKAGIWGMRGLDNASYYLLTRSPGTSGDQQYYYDITGTGNTLNTHHPKVQNLIVDSLNYQRSVLGIDGFRFDLGIALANTYDNTTNPNDTQRFYFNRTDPTTAFGAVTAALPGVFMASEPWGLVPNGQGYQLGNMPVGISEWNGAFRDTTRRLQNKYGVKDGDATRSQVGTRVAGSPDLFNKPGDGRNQPAYAVNFLNVHDGFTLKDLYSCNGQNVTQAWPLGPSDGGTADEDQWDNGADAAQQRQQARTGFALLMLSAGVPIFNAGDEFLRSLNCNNNSYNVDSTGSWLNYGVLGAGSVESNFRQFAAGMIQFRKNEPALRPGNFYSSVDTNGNSMAALDWFGSDKSYRTTYTGSDFWFATAASPDSSGQNRTLAWRYDGSELGGGDTILVLLNGEPTYRNFTLPWTGANRRTWCRVTDTASWAEGPNQVDLNASSCVGGENASYGVQPRALVVLVAR